MKGNAHYVCHISFEVPYAPTICLALKCLLEPQGKCNGVPEVE